MCVPVPGRGVCDVGCRGARRQRNLPGRPYGDRTRAGREADLRRSPALANVISLDRVSKGYAAVGPLLADVSLGLGDSERVGVVGLNGAGKSTLLRLLSRAEEPDAG